MDRGAVFYTLHGIIGLISISLLVITAITGMRKIIRNPDYKSFHRDIYYWGIIAFIGSIILGLLLPIVSVF